MILRGSLSILVIALRQSSSASSVLSHSKDEIFPSIFKRCFPLHIDDSNVFKFIATWKEWFLSGWVQS